MLEFDELTHTYTLEGEVIPGVTEVLQSVGMISEYITKGGENIERASKRGKAIHKAIELYEKGELGDHEGCEWAIEQWKEFKEVHVDWKVVSSEKPFASRDHNYAGTSDHLMLNNVTKKEYLTFLIDIKTGKKSPSWEIQLAAYAQLLEENLSWTRALKVKRSCLVLDEAKGWHLEKYDHRRHPIAFNTFRSALNIYKWRKEHKLF